MWWWIWTSRPGFEADLSEELRLARRKIDPRRGGPSLVASDDRPAVWPVFARAGFPVAAETAPRAEEAAPALAAAIDAASSAGRHPWLLQSWVPDSDETNPLAPRATALHAATEAALDALRPDLSARRLAEASDLARQGGLLGQLCLVSSSRVLVGCIAAQDVPTLAAGGRARARAPRDAPSRSARKLVEAFDWMARGPEPGELVVDLGAAPGGWTTVLLGRRARVVAVDPASLDELLDRRRGLTHVRRSAFDFAPDEPADWLCCDMAWRPLEVAALLAKWGRRRWAHSLVANVKLPMKRRVEFVDRVTRAVAEGGWRDLRARQLYHDREEFTLAAWR